MYSFTSGDVNPAASGCSGAMTTKLTPEGVSVPVVRDAHPLQRLLARLDVLQGPVERLQLVLDGGVLGGQAEGVPAEGVEDVLALHHPVSGDGVADAVVAEVAHVDIARRI